MLSMDLNHPTFTAKLIKEIRAIIKDAGSVVEVVGYELAKGGGWAVVVSTEYAALKVYYAYRTCKINMEKCPNGWAVTVKP